jgi:hypothetical protein
MARRNDDAAGNVVVIVIVLLIAFVKLLIGLAVSVCAYLGLPLLLIGAAEAVHGRAERRARCASLLEAAKTFDWRAQKQAIQELERERRDAQGKIYDIHALADAKGWRRTDASAGRRFDRRNAQAERFNQTLDDLEETVSSREYWIQQKKKSVSQSVPDWRAAHNGLVGLEASAAVLGIAAAIYMGVFLFFLALEPGWIQYLSEAAVWVIAPIQPAYGPAAVATVASLSIGALLREQKRRALDFALNVDLVAVWKGIEADIDTADHVAASSDDSAAESGAQAESGSRRRKRSTDDASSRARSPDAGDAWFTVLEVPENASAQEIRRAWKQRMSEYHPDTVATRGEKIRELAAKQTTAINEAYQTARGLGRV